ncbi:LPXTG cell wall anchor domain-containing protein [Lederbergia graminis]|uniref:LPXTG cell wall anchor domain-containing protein n=1 Tax=Lederbergia graminis TaxID=735518 RepID=A0ABW0LE92_9BACI
MKKKLFSIFVLTMLLLSISGVALAAEGSHTFEAESGTFDPEDQVERGAVVEGEDNEFISGFQNITASYTVPAELEAGEYKLSLRYISGVNPEAAHLKVTVGDASKEIKWEPTGEGDWDWANAKVLDAGTWDVNPGDVITLHTEGTDPYIQIDTLTLTSSAAGEQPVEDEGDENNEEAGSVDNPETGDTGVAMYIVLSGLALVAFTGLFFYRKKATN